MHARAPIRSDALKTNPVAPVASKDPNVTRIQGRVIRACVDLCAYDLAVKPELNVFHPSDDLASLGSASGYQGNDDVPPDQAASGRPCQTVLTKTSNHVVSVRVGAEGTNRTVLRSYYTAAYLRSSSRHLARQHHSRRTFRTRHPSASDHPLAPSWAYNHSDPINLGGPSMSPPTHRHIRRVCVLTGDHSLPDLTKPGGRYGPEDLSYHQRMRAALATLEDYEFEFLTDHGGLIKRMSETPPDLVLNFCDTGFQNLATQELHIPALLEMLGIAYSGAPPACMAICYDKALVRMVANALGVATPAERYVHAQDDLSGLEDFSYPAFVKPNKADGSVGISPDSLVRDPLEARSYVGRLRDELPGRAILLQEYLPGDEFGLALVGNPETGLTALPPLTVDYSALPEGLPPILAYESKTQPDSPYWTQVTVRPASLPAEALATMERDARSLFERLQCRDYARFDFRTGADGVIKLMEVNPNPAWDPEAKLATMASFAGIGYAQLLEMLLDAAQARLGR